MSAPAPSVYSDDAKQQIERLSLRKGKANLEAFADAMQSIAASDDSLLAVTSDSRGSGKLKPFGEQFPQQIVEVGIAEQDLVGVAAGLASCGKKVFAVSPGCFLTARSLEQIKNDVCYSDVPVTVVGISAGVSYGALGSTHHSLHDFAALRAIANITILAPGDNRETHAAVRWAAAHPGPVYLRFGKAAMYDLAAGDAPADPRKASVLRAGDDVALIGTGETTIHCLLAAAKLAEEGVAARVISMPCVKPLDVDVVLAASRECRVVVTAEEHSVHGGLGEACAAAILTAGLAPAFRIVGIPDEDTYTGSQAEIFAHYGVNMEGIVEQTRLALASEGAPR